MANAIPLLEGVAASGGYLVPDQLGDLLTNTIYREAAVVRLSRRERLVGTREKFPVYAGRPTAAFVGEGAPKGTTGAEFTELALNTKKIATQVIYTEEVLDDARIDPRVLVSADVEAAFADLIDAHALGYAAGASITGSFDNMLRTTTQTIELAGATPTADAVAKGISAAMGLIEGNGGKPNGIILPGDARQHFRDARDAVNTSVPLYTDGFNREPDTLYGMNISYSSNLPTLLGTAAAGRVVGIVGDFTHAIFGVRTDMRVRFSDQATIDVGGTLHHLWQQNKVAAQWEMRPGFVTHDQNRMFVALLNAA